MFFNSKKKEKRTTYLCADENDVVERKTADVGERQRFAEEIALGKERMQNTRQAEGRA